MRYTASGMRRGYSSRLAWLVCAVCLGLTTPSAVAQAANPGLLGRLGGAPHVIVATGPEAFIAVGDQLKRLTPSGNATAAATATA